jgi:hypothetical protein
MAQTAMAIRAPVLRDMPEPADVADGVEEISPARVMDGVCVEVGCVEKVDGIDVIIMVVWFAAWAVCCGGGGPGTVLS